MGNTWQWAHLSFLFSSLSLSFLSSFLLLLYTAPHRHITSAGLSINPGWETPFSPGFPTELVNPGLKAPFSPGSGNRD
jgi:hypothetical protein